MSDLLQQAIVSMEEKARQFERAASACRDCAEKIRAALGPVVAPVTARRPPAAPRKAARPRAVRPTSPTANVGLSPSPVPAVRDLDDRQVLDALKSAPRPLSRGQIFNSLSDPRPRPVTLRRRLQALASVGQVECRGERAATRYWTREQWASLDTRNAPRVEAAEAAEVKATAEPAASVVNGASLSESAKLRAEIRRVLASGASYDPKEIARNVRGAYPDINATALIPVLDHMAKQGECRRVTMDFGPVRYQSPLKPGGRK